MTISIKRRKALKDLLKSGRFAGICWISPVVVVVPLPAHAETTTEDTDFIDHRGPLYSQQLIRCREPGDSAVFEVKVCNTSGHTLMFDRFTMDGFSDRAGFRLNLHRPRLPLTLQQEKCTL